MKIQDYIFRSMGQGEAEEIADWHYEGIYSFYDAKNDAEDLEELLDPLARSEGNYYSYINPEDELVGYMCYEVKERTGVVGLGLKPALTGKGLGKSFLDSIIDYVLSKERLDNIELAVATFNKRAIRLYKKSGFEVEQVFMQGTNGGEYEFYRMSKRIK